MYDVIVIGAGPAGLSAAINVRQRGGSVLVIGLPKENNPLWKAEKVSNYPGLEDVSGEEMLDIFTRHAERMGADFNSGRVLNAYYTGDMWMVSAGNSVFESRAVIFAGGVSRGKTFPGEEEYLGRGVSYCATCDGMLYRQKDVAVIGFGPADQEEADYLAGIGCRVHYFEKPKSVEIIGGQTVSKAVIDGEELDVNGVFVLRPSLAPTSIFPGLELDGPYIRVDRDMAASLPALFAAGDCTGTPLQVAKAVGEGMIAGQKAAALAREINKKK